MEHYLPQIFWHDRTGLLSTDLHPVVKDQKYRIATSSVQKEVRIWEFFFTKIKKASTSIEYDEHQVNFIANLATHNNSVNIVRFAPSESENMLASGDSEGRLVVWRLSDQPCPTTNPEDDFPPNKENWVRYRVICHEQDVTAITWSPDGKLLASVGRDGHLMVHEVHTGKRTVFVQNFRQFPNGICWDPRGKYLIILSMDRKMDIVDCKKGTKLKSIAMADLPARSICGLFAEEKPYRLWHDDQLSGFQRGVAFSPCGELIVAPAVQMEVGSQDVYGTFVFKRTEIDKEKPFCLLPTPKATFLVRMCPLLFELTDDDENYTGLPYRVMWVVLSKEQLYIYDSQHSHPIGYVDNIHYNNLTDATWSSDGMCIVVSSLEGYNSFFKLSLPQWGVVLNERPTPPPSPQLIKTRRRKLKVENSENGSCDEKVQATSTSNTPTPTKPAKAKPTAPLTPSSKTQNIPVVTTPKTPRIDMFFKKNGPDSEKKKQEDKSDDKDSVIVIEQPPSTVAPPVVEEKPVNRIEVRKGPRIPVVTL